MTDREYTDANGVTWTFSQRPGIRENEARTHVALVIESAWDARIVSCPRAEWESAAPDYARLLGESLPVGASRGIERQGPSGAAGEPEF